MTDPSSGSAPSDVGREVSRDAEQLLDKAKRDASRVADTARQAGRQQAEKRLEDGKHIAGDQLDAVQHAVDDAAQRLQEEDSPFASYAGELSTQLSSLSSRIESSSVDELVRDGRRVARDNPGLFMLGAVAVGFAAARFLKASEQHDDQDYVSGPDRDAYQDGYRSAQGSGRSRYRGVASNSPYRRAASPPRSRVPMQSAGTTNTSTVDDGQGSVRDGSIADTMTNLTGASSIDQPSSARDGASTPATGGTGA